MLSCFLFPLPMWTFFKHCLRCCLFVFFVASDCLNVCIREFAKVASVLHHRGRADMSVTSRHWDWTLWLTGPLNCATIGKRYYFVSFSIFFAGLRAVFETVKMTSKSAQMAKSTTLNCLVLLSMSRPHLRGVGAVWCCDGAMVRPTNQIRVWRHDTGGWWQGLNSQSVQALKRRWARDRATRVQRHLAHQ